MKPTVNDVETFWWWKISMAAGWVTLLLVSQGCAAGGSDDVEGVFYDVPFGPAPVAVPVIATDGCRDSFAPSPELEADTLWALNEWEEATGKRLCINPEGIPIIFESKVHVSWSPDPMCGANTVAWDTASGKFMYNVGIRISRDVLGCVSPQQVLRHEIGHALAHVDYGVPIHVDGYSVMSPAPTNAGDIDQLAVDLVCATSDCPALESI